MRGGGPEISQGDPSAPRINVGREGSLGSRALAGIPISPEGSARALERLHGPGNVVTSEAGEIFIREGNEFYPLNRPGFSGGDVAGMSGAAIEAAPAIAATTFGGAAAGAAGGNLLRQGIGAALGERAGLGERAQSTAIAGGLGGASQAAVNAGARVINALRPSTVASTALAATAGRGRFRPKVAESETIEQALGIHFTPGQRTQSRSLLTLEGMVRRHPASADMMLQNDEAQLAQMGKALRVTLERFSPGEASTESAGNAVKRVFDRTLDSALQLRRTQAAVDFGKVDAAFGGAPLIRPDGLRGEIDAIVSELDVPGGGDATAAMVSKLKSMKAQLADRDLSAGQYQRLLQIYGTAARGKGKLFQDLDSAQQRWVAGRVSKALQGDLDAAIEGGGFQGEAAAALMAARQNYAANSQAVSELGRSTIGRLLNDRTGEFSPERLVMSLEKMQPAQLKRIFGMLEAASPDEAQLVKRGLMERVIERATSSEEVLARRLSQGQEVGEMISPAKMLTELRKSPLWPSLSGEERFGINQISQGMQRLANRAGTDGSPTAPLLFAADMAMTLTKSIGNPMAAMRLAMGIIAPRRLAETITSPAGQQAWGTLLRDLSRPRGQLSRAALGSLGYLAGRPVTEPAGQNVRPDAALSSAMQARQAQQSPQQGLPR